MRACGLLGEVGLCRRGLVGVYHCGRAPYYSVGTASGTTARAALAQSTSFCTVGAPLRPIAPTTSPFTLMGNPPPHAATRASVGMPAKSDGSLAIKLKKSCVETPNSAVYALFCAISMQRIGAPSIRPKALRLPPSSRIATFSVTPIFLAFANAASTIFCANSEETLCFTINLTIGLLRLKCICALDGGRKSRASCAPRVDEAWTGPPSAGGLASVDSEYVSRDEGCSFGSEKDGGTRDVGRLADAPKRHRLQERCFSLCGSREAVEHAGLDRTRSHGIDAHA